MREDRVCPIHTFLLDDLMAQRGYASMVREKAAASGRGRAARISADKSARDARIQISDLAQTQQELFTCLPVSHVLYKQKLDGHSDGTLTACNETAATTST